MIEYVKRLAGPFTAEGATNLPFGFKIFDPTDVFVAASTDPNTSSTALVYGKDYSVKMNEDQDTVPGGTVVLSSPISTGQVVVIGSAVAYTQNTQLTNFSRFPPEIINESLDRIVVQIQQLVELTGRTISLPPTSSLTVGEFLENLLNAAKDAVKSADEAAQYARICEEIKQNIFIYSWDIPHVVDTLDDVEKYPYDGFFAVGGYGDPGHHGQDISNRVVKASGSTKLRTLGERFADVVNVKDFGAVGDGVHDDTAAIQAACDSGSKHVFFPAGDYLLTSKSVSEGEGACVLLTAKHSGIHLEGSGASVLISKTNRLQLVCVDGAEDVLIDGFFFDNSQNGVLQNRQKPTGHGVPGGGVAGNGNNACAAIAHFRGRDLTVTDCHFDSFNLGIYYLGDHQDLQVLGGHLKSSRNSFCGCCFGHLLDTPKTYEVTSCRNEGNLDSYNADGSRDPGHLLYVTNRASAVPESGVVSDVVDVSGKNSCVKIRKSKTVSVSGVSTYGSGKGVEIVNVPNGAVSGCSIKLKNVEELTAQAGIELNDCGALSVSDCVVDIRGVDAWGVRIRKDTTTDETLNWGWRVDGVTVLADFSHVVGKAPINVETQKNFSIEGCKLLVYGTGKNTRPFIYLRDCESGIVSSPSMHFASENIVTEFVGLDSGSSGCRVFLSRLACPQILQASSNRLVFDDGTGNDIVDSGSLVSDGSASAPALAFAREPTTGIYRDADNRISFSVKAEKSVEIFGGSLRPGANGVTKLGYPSALWSELYAASGMINTSDERSKTSVVDPDEALMRAWSKVNFKVFQFKDAAEKKGTGARLHVGVIAQQVIEAFASEGLDAYRYGLLCYDKWDDEYGDVEVVDTPEVVDGEGNVTPAMTHVEHRLVTPAGDRYGIRYEEALALESAYLRWELQKIKNNQEVK